MKSVRCVDLCKTYRQGDLEVIGLDHVDLEIDEGGFVCLSAPSGGGKTTLLNAIGGLDTPDSGEIYLAGERIDNLGKGELAQVRLHQIGFVFQAYNLIPVLTARENVEFVMEVQGVAAGSRQERSLQILEEVGLGGLGDPGPHLDLPAFPSSQPGIGISLGFRPVERTSDRHGSECRKNL